MMQKPFNINLIAFFFGILILFFSACRNDNNPSLPRITTTPVSSITANSAVAGGNVLFMGGNMTPTKGICYSTNKTPTIADKTIISNSGADNFTVNMTGLTTNTTYHVRAYASNSAGTAYGDEIVFTTLTELYFGLEYAGGIVFYIDQTGQHGLAAATYDQSDAAEWGCYGTGISGTNTNMGTGQSNTTTIINACNTAGTAAQVCDALILNGYNDWYLPSKEELNLIYHNLYLRNMGNFTNGYYWSSSQYNDATSWAHYFLYGYQLNSNKNGKLMVRAIRSF